jgi:hypothetical protein
MPYLTGAKKKPPSPPSAFKWHTFVVGGKGGKITITDPYSPGAAIKALPALVQWAKENTYGLTPIGSAYYPTQRFDASVWVEFGVTKDVSETEKYFGNGTFRGPDGGTYPVGTVLGNNGGHLACNGCYIAGLQLFEVEKAGGGSTWLCPRCVSPCSTAGCKKFIYTAERVSAKSKGPGFSNKCASCAPLFNCGGCKKWHEKSSAAEGTFKIKGSKAEYQLCKTCHKTQVCQKCSTWQRAPALANCGDVLMCTTCSHEYADRERVKHETIPAEELPRHGSLQIPSLPARPFRTVSIETEVDGDKAYLSQTMFNCGLVRVPAVEAYGTAVPEATNWAAFLKHDGSVTGGELITYLLNMDNKNHADSFLDVLRKLRSLAKVGKVEFNPNCGGHIHIDAHNFDQANIWKLLTIWNFLEDVTYRLAGAGHKYGHRTQVAGHDRANHGGGYAEGVVKGPWGVKSAAGRAAQTQNRMCGLNFQPYFQAVSRCACGAYQKDLSMRLCTCNLGKCTIEWRVWNSQGNPRILHSWISYMQAMHALADDNEEPNKDFEDKFPALAWKKKPWISLTVHERNEVRKRLQWIFGNFVLTDDERDSLIYTIKESDMFGLGDMFINDLLKIKGPDIKEGDKPASRNPSSRKKPILVRKPKPGDDPFGNLHAGDRERLQYHMRMR